ncbi:hypothetical protein V5O48_018436, partial [Marasmius crinis-equi]
MLNNPDSAPNANINRWIEEIRLWHFNLVHVKGLVHGPDGLSRPPPGGLTTAKPDGWEEFLDEDDGQPVNFSMGEGETEEPYEYDDFRDNIDPRSGYICEIVDENFHLALTVEDFKTDLREAIAEERWIRRVVEDAYRRQNRPMAMYTIKELPVVPPVVDDEWIKTHPYEETHRSQEAKTLDDQIPDIIEWLGNPESPITAEMSDSQRSHFVKTALKFFVDDEGRLYR